VRISLDNLRTPETRRRLRLAAAFGLWGGTFLGLTMLAVNTARFWELPGLATRFGFLGGAAALAGGALGYLFYAGMIFGK
jgi:hypothetical protein